MRLLARFSLALLAGLLASGAGYRYLRPSSPVASSASSEVAPVDTSHVLLPLTEEEAWSWETLEHEVRKAHEAWLTRTLRARSLDPRTSFDPRRGVLIAPVTSSP